MPPALARSGKAIEKMNSLKVSQLRAGDSVALAVTKRLYPQTALERQDPTDESPALQGSKNLVQNYSVAYSLSITRFKIFLWLTVQP